MKDNKKKIMRTRPATSIIYLVITMIIFGIIYGLLDILTSVIINYVLTVTPPDMSASWTATNTQTRTVIGYLIPLLPALGIMIFIIRPIMIATIRGQD